MEAVMIRGGIEPGDALPGRFALVPGRAGVAQNATNPISEA